MMPTKVTRLAESHKAGKSPGYDWNPSFLTSALVFFVTFLNRIQCYVSPLSRVRRRIFQGMRAVVGDLNLRPFYVAVTFFYYAQFLTYTKVERIETQSQQPASTMINLQFILFISLPTLPPQIILKQTQTYYFTHKYYSMHLQKIKMLLKNITTILLT